MKGLEGRVLSKCLEELEVFAASNWEPRDCKTVDVRHCLWKAAKGFRISAEHDIRRRHEDESFREVFLGRQREVNFDILEPLHEDREHRRGVAGCLDTELIGAHRQPDAAEAIPSQLLGGARDESSIDIPHS